MAQILDPIVGPADRLRVGFAGHEENHEALLRGDLDLYAEYTGTALRRYLKLDPQPRHAVLATVRQAARERWNLHWLEPFGFDNGYGLIMRAADAATLGVRSISELAAHAAGLRLGGTAQFLSNEPPMTFAPGGAPGLFACYGLRFGSSSVVGEGYGASFEALARGECDVLADFVVNPRIMAHDLLVLEDDRALFAAYYAVPVVRGAVLEAYPALKPALERLAWRVDNSTMAGLSYQMEFEGRDPAEVAAAFLRSLKP